MQFNGYATVMGYGTVSSYLVRTIQYLALVPLALSEICAFSTSPKSMHGLWYFHKFLQLRAPCPVCQHCTVQQLCPKRNSLAAHSHTTILTRSPHILLRENALMFNRVVPLGTVCHTHNKHSTTQVCGTKASCTTLATLDDVVSRRSPSSLLPYDRTKFSAFRSTQYASR